MLMQPVAAGELTKELYSLSQSYRPRASNFRVATVASGLWYRLAEAKRQGILSRTFCDQFASLPSICGSL